MECIICFEDKNNFKKLWICNHSFCNDCLIKLQNRSSNLKCPICRTDKLLNYVQNHHNLNKNVLNINKVKKKDKLINESHYISQWKQKTCIDHNHTLIVRRIYGVIVICETCNLFDCFNYTLS